VGIFARLVYWVTTKSLVSLINCGFVGSSSNLLRKS
jgi:hypothetical protein